MHSDESDDILIALKSAGESPMNPLGTNTSLTVKGRDMGPASAVESLLSPGGAFEGGGVEPGAEHPIAAAKGSAPAKNRFEVKQGMAAFAIQEVGRGVTPTECRRCRR